MSMLPHCKHCDKECKSSPSLRNHERLCKLNPDRDIASTEAARARACEPILCRNCGIHFPKTSIKKHERGCSLKDKTCQHCSILFRARHKNQQYCGNKCANNATKYKPRKDNRYTSICFRYHEKKCIICDEDKIVAVHHYDENHENDDPANLVPLCPTHHQYIHSRYRCEIIDAVDLYVSEFKIKLSMA